jgi:putative hemolysin
VIIAAETAAGIPWYLDALRLASVPALVALNGFFVAAEFSLVSLRRTKIEEMLANGVNGAKAVDAATTKLDRTIASTQLGITLASIILGWVAEPTIARLIEPAFRSLAWHEAAVHSVASGLALLLVTYMHVVFGEYVPKSLAIQSPDGTALWVAKPLIAFARITAPLTSLMKESGNAVLRLMGHAPASGEESVHSIEELRLLIEDTEEAGLLDEDQAEFVQNVFLLSNKRVRDCMVPREKMAALDVNTPPDKVLDAVRNGAHTRMPVYDGTLDRVVGIVNTKDLFYLFSTSGLVVLEDAIYPATFLPPDEDIANALRLLQRSRRPMALVRDEDDKILGMITLEDVIEEIVGDIEDEHDRPMRKVRYRRRPVKNLTPQPPSLRGKGEKTMESPPPFPLREGGPGGLGSSSPANGVSRPSPVPPRAAPPAAAPPAPAPPPPTPAPRGSAAG